LKKWQAMSFFERAFLQAVKRRRIHHPTRLKIAIRSFNQLYLSKFPHNPNSPDSVFPDENELHEPGEAMSDTVISGDMAKLLMRKGFVAPPNCTPLKCSAN
jgi:hypothetical protein